MRRTGSTNAPHAQPMTWRRRDAMLWPLMAAAMGTAGCATPRGPIDVEHAKGRTTLPAVPRRVLVFDPGTLDNLQALGVPVLGVPNLKFPPYLASYDAPRHLRVGTLFEPDLAAVAAAQPDLIVVAGRSGAAYEKLAAVAPTLDLAVDPKRHADSVFRNLRTLGRVFGREARAEVRIAAAQASIDAVRRRATGRQGLLLLAVGGRFSGFGPGSRFGGLLHDDFGIAPALPGLDPAKRNPLTLDDVARIDPQWLFVIDRDAAVGRDGVPARGQVDPALVSGTRAAREGRAVFLDPALWYVVGVAGVDALQSCADQAAASLAARANAT